MTDALEMALERNIQAADQVIKTGDRLNDVLCLQCSPYKFKLRRLSSQLRAALAHA